jgi:hypothetical protein
MDEHGHSLFIFLEVLVWLVFLVIWRLKRQQWRYESKDLLWLMFAALLLLGVAYWFSH